MKYLITIFILSCCLCITAQPPQLLKYQGIARDSTGNPVSNDTIALRISIHQGTPTGTVVYKETHFPITNQFGSFSINIGGGTVITGNFSNVPWYSNNYFQEVEMDVNGGSNFVTMGTSQYLSVPYAFNSDNSFFARFADSSDVAVNTVNGGFSHLQVFNSSGTFTVPAGVTKVMVELWGAGGGGGGGGGGGYSNAGGTGGGGGGGGYVKDIVNLSPGASVTVTIGNGGSGGLGGFVGTINSPGQNGFSGLSGGSSSFDANTAGGGTGGNGGQGGPNGANGTGGSGGIGGNAPGLFGIGGEFGQSGTAFGFGGSSPNGGFGGNPGGDKTPGGGGSGGVGQYGNGNNGTNGGKGRVVVWW